jgi:hypothetical protein
MRSTLVHIRRVFATCWHSPNTFACWLRAAYPQWSPRPGHVPLIALCGQEGSLIEQRPQSARPAS